MTRGEITRALDLTDRLSAEYSPERLVAKYAVMQHEVLDEVGRFLKKRIKANVENGFSPYQPLNELADRIDTVLALWPEETTDGVLTKENV